MNLLSLKGIVALSWACSVVTLGLVAQTSAITGWVTLLLVAMLPPAVLMHRWKEPLPSMSRHIQAAPR